MLNTVIRYCRYCGCSLPEGSTSKKLYCSARCRREYQNARRKDERAEMRELMKGNNPMDDPWQRTGIDEWTDEIIWENALLDPMP